MRWTGWGAGAAAATLLVVTACGAHSTAPSAHEPSSARPPSPTDGNGSLVPPLPTLTTPVTTPKRPRSTRPTQTPEPSATAAARVFGADASWPQCPKGMGIPQKRTEGAPMPTAAAEFVVLGLTNGPSFVANPCLESQVQWVKDRHLLAAAYSVVSYPDARTLAQVRDRGPYDAGTRIGALRNAGYQAALYNVDTMHRVGLQTPVVWIDVEPVTGFDWSRELRANAAVVQGVARGYHDAGFRIGFYSIGSLWTRVVGGLSFGAPEWRPAGPRGLREALTRCADGWSFQGGKAIFGQWIEDRRDRDVTCPGAVADLRDWFHQY